MHGEITPGEAQAALAAAEREPPSDPRPELYGGGQAGRRISAAIDSYTGLP